MWHPSSIWRYAEYEGKKKLCVNRSNWKHTYKCNLMFAWYCFSVHKYGLCIKRVFDIWNGSHIFLGNNEDPSCPFSFLQLSLYIVFYRQPALLILFEMKFTYSMYIIVWDCCNERRRLRYCLLYRFQNLEESPSIVANIIQIIMAIIQLPIFVWKSKFKEV